MALTLKKLQAYAKSPQAKKLFEHAKKLDTPANRKKAKELVAKLRDEAGPAAKKAASTTKAKAARPKPQGGAPAPPA